MFTPRTIERIDYEPRESGRCDWPINHYIPAEYLFLAEAVNESGQAREAGWATSDLFARSVSDGSWIGNDQEARAHIISDQIEPDPERPGNYIVLAREGRGPTGDKNLAVACWRMDRPVILSGWREEWFSWTRFERTAAHMLEALRVGDLCAGLLVDRTAHPIDASVWGHITDLGVFGLRDVDHGSFGLPPPNQMTIGQRTGSVVVAKEALTAWLTSECVNGAHVDALVELRGPGHPEHAHKDKALDMHEDRKKRGACENRRLTEAKVLRNLLAKKGLKGLPNKRTIDGWLKDRGWK